MFKLNFLIKSFDLNKRAHAEIMKKIHRDVMVRQQYDRLPKHFEEVAFAEYGYARRKSHTYEIRKMRKYGHNKPNVYSGVLRRAVLKKCKITATQHKGRLETSGTSKHRLTDWQRREIETVSQKEQDLEYKRMARDYKRLATSDRYRRKRTRRTKA